MQAGSVSHDERFQTYPFFTQEIAGLKAQYEAPEPPPDLGPNKIYVDPAKGEKISDVLLDDLQVVPQ